MSLEVTHLFEPTGGDATSLLRGGSTGGNGSGGVIWIAPDTVRLIRGWLEAAAISARLVFRSFRTGGTIGERLHPSQVPRIFKAVARKPSLSEAVIDGFSGNSARIGAAQDMLAAGIELPAILDAGRWKSAAMLNRYLSPT